MSKQYTTAPILVNDNGDPIPQYLDTTDTTDSPQGTFKPLTDENDKNIVDRLEAIETRLNQTLETQLTGSNLEEQLTESEAINGVLTFSDVIHEIEIYNRDSTDGTFTVNGIGIIVPSNEAFQAKIGGNPSTDVTVTGSTSYVVGRYA